MKKTIINTLTLVMLAIVTPIVLLLWIITKSACYFTKKIKINASDFWEIVNIWDDWIYAKYKECFD